MLVRSLLAVLVGLAALAGSATAQNQCGTATQFFCQTVETIMPNVGSLQLTFQYIATGTICSVSTASLSTTNPTRLVTSTSSTVPTSGTVTVTTIPATGTTAYEASSINNLVFTLPTTNGSPLTLTGPLINCGTASNPCATVTYAPFGLTNAQINPVTQSMDICSSNTFGDPHFTGFGGQKFSVFGKPGDVMNILQASNMQLNARLVQLNDGDSITDAEQKIVKKVSSAYLPETHAFDYPGPYMGELGLATISGNRLYAKAGHFLSGWAEVRLDDKEWTAIGETVELGQGADAVAVTRMNAFEISVETRLVHLVISNSDLFFNIENAHLERAMDKHRRPFAGALGQSARLGWVAKENDAEWQSKMEAECRVDSGDLYEMSAIKPTSADSK